MGIAASDALGMMAHPLEFIPAEPFNEFLKRLKEILAEREWVIVVDGFLGGNSNPTTGRYSFGIRGTLYEGGTAVSPISEMNITGSIFDLLDGFVEAANDTWTNGACRSPSLLFDAVQFSGQ